MDELKQKTIRIASWEAKQTQNGKEFFKLKDENNLTFTVWKLKSDGTVSKAGDYIMRNMAQLTGKTLDVSYKETQGTFTDKQGKQGTTTYRTVAWFQEGIATNPTPFAPMTHVPATPTPNIQALEDRVTRLEQHVGIFNQMTDSSSPQDDLPPIDAYHPF